MLAGVLDVLDHPPARSGSMRFSVRPSTFMAVPTMAPSATSRMRSTVSCRTPVLAITGISGTAAFVSSRSAKRKGSPARGPEMSAALQPKKCAPWARSATVRVPSGDANSGVRLVKMAMSSAPIEWR